MKRTKDYEEFLIEQLKKDRFAVDYLNEALKDKNQKYFLLAIKHVIEARGGMAEFARKTNLNRGNLYQILSENGNPEFETILKILDALGLKFKFHYSKIAKLAA